MIRGGQGRVVRRQCSGDNGVLGLAAGVGRCLWWEQSEGKGKGSLGIFYDQR